MKTILRGLVVACSAALGLNAWAETTVWSNLNSSETTVERAGAADVVLCLQPTAEVPAGSSVKLTKIVIADRPDRDSTTPVYKITVGGTDYYTNERVAGDQAQVNTGAQNPVSRGMSIYTFSEGSEPVITVGMQYGAATCNADHSAQTGNARGGASCAKVSSPATSGILWWNHSTSTTSGWNVLGELHGTVVETPGAGDYVASVSEDCNFSAIAWDRGLNWDDATTSSTLFLNIASGKTVTLDKDINVASILISGGTLSLAADTTCTIAGAGTISSKVTTAAGSTLNTNGNIAMGDGATEIAGALNVNGGTLTLTTKSNGGLNNNVLTIAPGATFKSGNNDMPYWDGEGRTTTIKVYGTLDFASTRWTFAAGEKVIAYAGAEIKGAGDAKGAGIDPNGNTGVVLQISNEGGNGTVTLNSAVRARAASQIEVQEGMILLDNAGIGNADGQNSKITKIGAGTWHLKHNTANTNGLQLDAGKLIVDGVTVAGGVVVGENASMDIEATSELVMPTIKDGSVGKVTIKSGTVNVQGQRVALDVLDGATVKIVATTDEIASGAITLPVPEEHAQVSDSKVSVVDQNGQTVAITGIAEGTEPNTIVISLQTNAPITETCNLSDKIAGKTGTIVVQGATGEADPIVITVDCAIPEGLQLTVTGKADFAFGEGSEVSAGTIKLDNGSVATVSGTINNTITLSDGATIVTSGDVTFGAGKQIVRTANNKNATLTIGSGSTLALAAANSVNTAVTLNVYGTLDLGGCNVDFKSNSPEAAYNLYVGSVIKNGTVVHQGGYDLTMNVLDVEAVTEKTVAFSANINLSGWTGVKNIFSTAANTSVDFTGSTSNVGSLAIRNSNGIGLRVMKGTYGSGTARALKGDIVVDAGATLSVTVGDGFEYENNKANLDVYGTINVNANRQTLSSSNQSYGAGTIKLHNGAQITGAGASHKSTTVGLDIWNATTIEVDGTVTISTPLYGEAERSTVSFVKAEGAETAVVNMTGLNTLNGGFKVGDGVVVDCGADKATKYTVTLQGGTLQWAGAGNAHGQLVKNVTLTKDSRLACTTAGNQIGIGVAGAADTTLDLAGHTLTMAAKQASDRVYFDKTSITSAGTLKIEQGIMFIHCKHLGTVAGVNLVIGENASAQVAGDATFEGERTIEVANLTYNGTLPTQEHPTFVVSGTFKGTGSLANLTLSDGATIDVAAVPESGVVASATQTLTIGDISTIKLAIAGVETTDYTLSISEDAKSVIATKKATRPSDVESGSQAQKDAFDAWVKKYSVTNPSTANVNAFILDMPNESTDAELKTKLASLITPEMVQKLAADGATTETTVTIPGYGNAVFKFVPATLGEGVTTSAKLFRLTAEFVPANAN